MMTVMTAIMCPVFVCGKQYSVSQLALHLAFVFVFVFFYILISGYLGSTTGQVLL